MMTANRSKVVNVYGDVLQIHWDGNVWVSPHNGQQHARARDAMRAELERYFSDCGEDVEDRAGEIDGYLSQMTDGE